MLRSFIYSFEVFSDFLLYKYPVFNDFLLVFITLFYSSDHRVDGPDH